MKKARLDRMRSTVNGLKRLIQASETRGILLLGHGDKTQMDNQWSMYWGGRTGERGRERGDDR
jgi:hypothetical protein